MYKYNEIDKITEPLDYDDSLFKEHAKDIVESTDKTAEQIKALVEESRESSKQAKKLSIITLIVAVLTLIATIIGIFIK